MSRRPWVSRSAQKVMAKMQGKSVKPRGRTTVTAGPTKVARVRLCGSAGCFSPVAGGFYCVKHTSAD